MAIQRLGGLSLDGALRFGGLPLDGAARVAGLGPLPAGLGPEVSVAAPTFYWTFEEETWGIDYSVQDVVAGALLEPEDTDVFHFTQSEDAWFGETAAAAGPNYFADSQFQDGAVWSCWFKGSLLVYFEPVEMVEPHLLFSAELSGKTEWSHAVLVWHSDWTTSLYLNGVLATTGSIPEPESRDLTRWTFLLQSGGLLDELAYWRGTVDHASGEQDLVDLLYNEGDGAVWRDDQWWEVTG